MNPVPRNHLEAEIKTLRNRMESLVKTLEDLTIQSESKHEDLGPSGNDDLRMGYALEINAYRVASELAKAALKGE